MLSGGELLLHLRHGDRCAQAVLAYHPSTADSCRLYVSGLCVVPPDAKGGRSAFFIDWISSAAKKQEDKTLLDRNVRGIGIALCLLTLFPHS